MSAHPRPLDWGLLLALTVLWGSAFLLTKVAVTALPPDLVVAGRLAIGCLILVPLALLLERGSRRRGGRAPWGLRLWLFLLAIGVFGFALPLTLISWGQEAIDSGLAGILMAVMPLGTLGLAHYLVPGERMTRYRAGGFLLGFAGVVVLMGPESLLGLLDGQGPWLRMLAVLVGALCYAVSAILARLRPPSASLASAAATLSIAAVLSLVPLLGAADAGGPVPTAPGGWSAWAAVGALGVFSTALASVVYFKLVSRAGPGFVSQLNYLIPLWAVLVGTAFLDERPEPRHLLALALILGGILMAHLERRRSRPPGTPPRESAPSAAPRRSVFPP